MMVFSRGAWLALVILTLCLASPAGAQENLDSGKTPAQLFASDCALCHKTPQGLARGGGLLGLGLDNFLRAHYTASRESAVALSRYIQAVDKGPAAPARPVKRTAKGSDKPKGSEKKPDAGKAGAAGSGEPKPGEAKVTEPKSTTEPKAAEPAPSEPKPSESKPAESPKAN